MRWVGMMKRIGLSEVFDSVGYSEKATYCRMLMDSTCLKPDLLLFNLTCSIGATSLVVDVGIHYLTQSLTSAPVKV